MKALSIIKTEHRNLGAVLYTLEKLLDEIETGKSPDFKVFHGILTYLDRFLDTYHHPKEDQYLFPLLRKRSPSIHTVLDELESEHRMGAHLIGNVYKALSAYEFMGRSELSNFSTVLRHYVAFERDHAMEEERRVLPMAQEHLLQEDWDHIDRAFADNSDPLFGDAPSAGFEALHTLITSMVPEPHGFGAQWK